MAAKPKLVEHGWKSEGYCPNCRTLIALFPYPGQTLVCEDCNLKWLMPAFPMLRRALLGITGVYPQGNKPGHVAGWMVNPYGLSLDGQFQLDSAVRLMRQYVNLLPVKDRKPNEIDLVNMLNQHVHRVTATKYSTNKRVFDLIPQERKPEDVQ